MVKEFLKNVDKAPSLNDEQKDFYKAILKRELYQKIMWSGGVAKKPIDAATFKLKIRDLLENNKEDTLTLYGGFGTFIGKEIPYGKISLDGKLLERWRNILAINPILSGLGSSATHYEKDKESFADFKKEIVISHLKEPISRLAKMIETLLDEEFQELHVYAYVADPDGFGFTKASPVAQGMPPHATGQRFNTVKWVLNSETFYNVIQDVVKALVWKNYVLVLKTPDMAENQMLCAFDVHTLYKVLYPHKHTNHRIFNTEVRPVIKPGIDFYDEKATNIFSIANLLKFFKDNFRIVALASQSGEPQIDFLGRKIMHDGGWTDRWDESYRTAYTDDELGLELDALFKVHHIGSAYKEITAGWTKATLIDQFGNSFDKLVWLPWETPPAIIEGGRGGFQLIMSRHYDEFIYYYGEEFNLNHPRHVAQFILKYITENTPVGRPTAGNEPGTLHYRYTVGGLKQLHVIIHRRTGIIFNAY